MSTLARSDISLISRWWWTVDRWSLAAVAALVVIGAVLILAASPPVAERIGLQAFHFAQRQFTFLFVGVMAMLAVSLLTPAGVRRLAVLVFAVSLLLTGATSLFGDEIKGASRWIFIGGFSLQPSEFLKPSFAVAAAWMFAAGRTDDRVPGDAIATGFFIIVMTLLIMQPDVGMSVVVFWVWGTQFFLVGLPIALVVLIVLLFLGGLGAAYLTFSHVRIRLDRFLDPAAEEGYQVSKALEAFHNGGFFGTGPGEGQVKLLLPDAHADFIFAVAGEEFGLIASLIMVALFAFVVLRGFFRVSRENDLFVLLAVAGLLSQFGFQAIINMSSTINLIPPKGTTLPFISYGGSSTLALALAMGMVLALTRRRPDVAGKSP